jgi:hypothetical protein
MACQGAGVIHPQNLLEILPESHPVAFVCKTGA